MQTVKEFGGGTPQLSLHQFWIVAGPVVAGIYLLVIIQVYLANTGLDDYIIRFLDSLIAIEIGIIKAIFMEPLKPFVKMILSRREKASDLETHRHGRRRPTRA